MSPGVWVSESQFLDFGEALQQGDRSALEGEMASRQTAWDSTGWLGLLPDPDPVLRKLPDGGVGVLEGLTSDAHLLSVMQSRKLGTLKKEYRWEAGTRAGAEATPEAERLRDQLAEDLERVDLYTLLSGILDAPFYGMSPVELLWAPEKGRARLRDLVVKPPRWFGFDDENRPRFVSQANPWLGEELPFGKFVFARHFPTYDNPYGLRLLSRCFWPVTFKKGGVRFWVTLAEKYGMPFLLGKYANGTTVEKQREMLSALAAMVRDAVAVIPDNGSVEILEAFSSGGGADIHSGLKAAMDAEMSKVVMGQTLTAEVGQRGSLAAGQVHEGILEDFRGADQTLAKTTLDEIAWVFGQVNAPDVPPPVFTWWEEDDPKKEVADRDKVISETGVKFRKSYYVRQFGYQEDDFDVPEPVSVPPQTPPTTPDTGPSFSAPTPAPAETPDLQVSRLETEAGPALDAWIQAIRAALDEAQSLPELQRKITEAFPALSAADMTKCLAEAMAAAALAGRYELLAGV